MEENIAAARELLSALTTTSLSNEDFPYFTGRELDLHHARGLAFRMRLS